MQKCWAELLQLYLLLQTAASVLSASHLDRKQVSLGDVNDISKNNPSISRNEDETDIELNLVPRHPLSLKKRLAALELLLVVAKNLGETGRLPVSDDDEVGEESLLDDSSPPSRASYSRAFLKKKTKKKVILKLAADGASAAADFAEELADGTAAEEISEFVDEMEQLAAMFSTDGSSPDPVPAVSGFDVRVLWDILSGARLSQMMSEVGSQVTGFITNNPLTEMIQPILDLVENNDFSEMLNTDRLRGYLTGEGIENNDVAQLVSVISPAVYEFPLKCNTSRSYTNKFHEGLCVRLADCIFFEGESFGTCGLGTGSCCVFHNSCEAMTNEWISHFTNPPNVPPGPGVGSCRYTIEPRSNNICQYRLDFIHFKVAGPNVNSVCENDFFEVFGGARVPKLCGDLTGQHIYVDVSPGEYLQLSVYAASSYSMKRSWNIKITQINCNGEDRVPAGCLQFYNSTTGRVMSFNHKKEVSPKHSEGHQLSNANYGICVNPLPGHCAILWQEAGEDGFSVSGDAIRGSGEVQTGMVNCTKDHLVIPGAVFRDPVTRQLREDTRFCGTKLPKIITNRQPYIIRVVSDKTEEGDIGNAGFDLAFKQIKCIE